MQLSRDGQKIKIDRARSAAITALRNPPFFAWITVPCELGAEV